MISAKWIRNFTIVPSQKLATLLQAKGAEKPSRGLLIIDVREPENYAKAHIKDAINWDSRLLLESRTLQERSDLLRELEKTEKVEIYVHCHLSLIRGPLSSNHLEGLLKRDAKTTSFKVYLIEGGWKAWKREHPDLVVGQPAEKQ